ncbi:MAG: AAA family ATPase [Candidatus Kariarchaeaceae archaeon]
MEVLFGKETVFQQLEEAYNSKIPVIIKGFSGSGKRFLISYLEKKVKQKSFRTDGNDSLNTSRLLGWFDPVTTLKKGYCEESFIPGPFLKALKTGGIFFFQEVNRAPSETVNVVLTALDEKIVVVPKLGEIKAHPDFFAIFSVSEGDKIGTHLLPRAFYDRCITLSLSLPPSNETLELIFKHHYPSIDPLLINKVTKLLDQSWQHPQVEAGASINAGIQLLRLLQSQISEPENELSSLSFLDIAVASFAKKIVLVPTADMTQTEVVQDLARRVETNRLFPPKKRFTPKDSDFTEWGSSGKRFQTLKDKEEQEEEIRLSAQIYQELAKTQPSYQLLYEYARMAVQGGAITPLSTLSKAVPDTVSRAFIELGVPADLLLYIDEIALSDIFLKIRGRLSDEVKQQLLKLLIPEIMQKARVISERGKHSGTIKYLPYEPGKEWDIYETIERMLSLGEKKPSYDSIVCPEVDKRKKAVVLCIDSSTSVIQMMHRITLTAAVLAHCLRDDHFAIIAFDTSPHIIKSIHQERSIYSVVEDVLLLESGGRTDISSALVEAKKQLAKLNQAEKKVIVISDFEPTKGVEPIRNIHEFTDFRAVVTWRQKLSPMVKQLQGLRNVTIHNLSNSTNLVKLISEMLFES